MKQFLGDRTTDDACTSRSRDKTYKDTAATASDLHKKFNQHNEEDYRCLNQSTFKMGFDGFLNYGSEAHLAGYGMGSADLVPPVSTTDRDDG